MRRWAVGSVVVLAAATSSISGAIDPPIQHATSPAVEQPATTPDAMSLNTHQLQHLMQRAEADSNTPNSSACASALLFVGDSRDRGIYADRLLTGDCQETGTRVMTLNKSDGSPCDFFMDGIATCRRGPIQQLGHFCHYGVSADGIYSPAAYQGCHSHSGWNGGGWSPEIDSPALVIEAVRRFVATQLGRQSHLIVVFSSMMWDVARRCLQFPDEPFEQWSESFLANYTELVDAVAKIVAAADGTLVLTTGYLPSYHWHCFTLSNHSGTNFTHVHFTQEVVRRLAPRVGAVLLDQQVVLRTHYKNGPRDVLMDDKHANEAGRALIWVELRATVNRVLQKRGCSTAPIGSE